MGIVLYGTVKDSSDRRQSWRCPPNPGYVSGAKSNEFAIDWKQTLSGGLKSLGENKYDAVLLDLGLPDSPQRSVTFTRTQATAPTIPIVILTGLDDETFAVTTVRRGAHRHLD